MHASKHINNFFGVVLVDLFYAVARDEVILFDFAEFGNLHSATLAGIGATSAEGATRGRVKRGGDITRKRNALRLARDLGIGHRNRGHKRL